VLFISHIALSLLVMDTASNNQIPHQSCDVMRTYAIHDLSQEFCQIPFGMLERQDLFGLMECSIMVMVRLGSCTY